MKKFLALIMALAMVFALVACGQTEGNESIESIEEVIVVSSEESTSETSSTTSTTSTTTPTSSTTAPTPSTTAPTSSTTTPTSSEAPAACTHKNVEVTPAVAANCAKEGKTEGKTCKDCGEVIVASQSIPKTEQHFFTAATTEKPATCTVCGLTRGGVKEDTPSIYIANPTMSTNGATITFSVKQVKYVDDNKTQCNIIYHVSIKNGASEGTYSWKVDVAHGDVGSIIVGNIPGATPNSLAPNETFEQDFETGPVGLAGPVGYKLTFK